MSCPPNRARLAVLLAVLPALCPETSAAAPAPPEAFVRALDAFADRALVDPAPRLRAMAEDRKAHPLLAAHTRWLLARLDRDAGRAPELDALGLVRRWEVVGPFEAAPLETPLAPETTGAASFPGKEHAVAWHDASEAARFGVLDVGAVTHNATPGVVYARTAFELAAGGAVALRIGTTGPYQVWIDGQRVAAGGDHRRLAFDQDAALVSLAAGQHRLLVKLASRDRSPRLVLRLSTPDGAPIVFAPGDPAAPVTATAAPALTTPIALAHPLATAEAAAAAAPKDAARARTWARLLSAFQPEGPDDPRIVAAWEAARALAPKDADLYVAYAHALEVDRDHRRRLLEEALRLDPKHARALRALARHQAARGLVREAEALWARLLAVAPEDPEAALGALGPIERAGLTTTLRRRLAALNAAHPTHPRIARRHAEALLEVDRVPDAEAVLRRALAAHATHRGLRARLHLALARRADVDALLTERADAARVLPFSTQRRIDEAWLQFGNDAGDGARRTAALEGLEAATRVAPERPELWAALGHLHHRAGAREPALAAWRRSLELSPQQAELRRALAWFDPDERSLAALYGRDVAALAADPPPPPEDRIGAYTLFDTTAIEVHKNGLATRYHQYAIRLLDKVQQDAVRFHQVSYTPGEESVRILAADVFRPDGQVLGASRTWTERPFGKVGGVYSDFELRVVAFDELEPGDVIHVAYVLDQVGSSNLFDDFFGLVEGAQSLFPRVEWSLIVRMPAGRTLRHHTEGLPAPVERPVERQRGSPPGGEGREWRWDAVGLPGIVSEPWAAPYLERGAYVSASTFERWRDVARWYRRLVRGQDRIDEATATWARELAARARATAAEAPPPGRPSKGDAATAAVVEALFERVVAETRYVGIEFGIHGFKPYRADQVLRRGYGDCKDKANLLVTLLAAAGVEAEIVLVRTFDRGHVADDPPSPWLFDHAIVYVPPVDRYLDPTTENGGPWELPWMDQGAQALRVPAEEGDAPVELVVIPVSEADGNLTAVEATLRLLPTGEGVLTQTDRITGTGAADLRRGFRDAVIGRRQIEQLVARAVPGATVLDLDVRSIDRLRPADLAFTARLPGLYEPPAGDEPRDVQVTVFPVEMRQRWARSSERSTPMVIDYPRRHALQLTVEVPEGLRFEPPPELDLTTPFGRYRRHARQAGQRWVIEREVAITTRRVALDDYPRFHAFCAAVEQAEAAPGRLVRTAGDGT